jgi:hypothetical protein
MSDVSAGACPICKRQAVSYNLWAFYDAVMEQHVLEHLLNEGFSIGAVPELDDWASLLRKWLTDRGSVGSNPTRSAI